MSEHDLKVVPPYFDALLDGSKPFEVRMNDRDFRVGDTLRLREWLPEAVRLDRPDMDGYTGRVVHRRVTYVLERARHFGLDANYVVLGLAVPDAARATLRRQLTEFITAYTTYVRAVDAISPEHGLLARLLNDCATTISAPLATAGSPVAHDPLSPSFDWWQCVSGHKPIRFRTSDFTNCPVCARAHARENAL